MIGLLLAHAGEAHGPNTMLLVGIVVGVLLLSFAAAALVSAVRAVRTGRLGRRERS